MKTSCNSYAVARIAGVSRTVVSAVLHGKADKYRIPKKTQDRVRAAIRQTGYVPDTTIRDMFLKRRELIGIASPSGAPDAEMVGDAVKSALSAAGLKLHVSPLSTEPAEALDQVKTALRAPMAVLIVPPISTVSSARK